MSSPPTSPPSSASAAEASVRRLADLARAVGNSAGWTRRLIAVSAGFVSVAAFAPVFVWPVFFLTLPVLVWLIDGDDTPAIEGPSAVVPPWRRAFLDGWWWGFGYFVANLFWLGEAFLVEPDKHAWQMPLAVAGLPAFLAVFYGTATALARLLWRPGWPRILALALTLGSIEWLRGHVLTGLPWNMPGYALTGPLVLMQSSALLGPYGLTLWAIVIFSAPLTIAAEAPASATRRQAGTAIAALMLAVLAAYGVARLSASPEAWVEGVKLRIVQPSIPQRDKWMPEKQREIFDLHLAMSRMTSEGRVDDLAGVTHLIWPEAAMPFRPLEQPAALEAIGALLPPETYLLSGALRTERVDANARPYALPRVYNSLLVFGRSGGLAGLYDKIHLVPFGEYLPFQDALEAWGLRQLSYLPGGIASGPSPRPLIRAGRLPPASVLICYEAIFPGEVVQGPERPGLILTITNDGWFGDTTGPRQHFHQARVRAVEEGVPLVRAANNGISALVDPNGRVLEILGMNARGVIDGRLPAALPAPPYARWGDKIFALNLALGLVLLMASGSLSSRRAPTGI